MCPSQIDGGIVILGIRHGLIGSDLNRVADLCALHPIATLVAVDEVLEVHRTVTALHNLYRAILGLIVQEHAVAVILTKHSLTRTLVSLRLTLGRLNDDAMFIDGQQAFHGELEIFLWHKVFEILTIADSTRHMQVHNVHIVHGRGVDLAVQTEAFSQMGNLQSSRNTAFPGNICPNDICSLLIDNLSHTPVTTTGCLCGSNRKVESFAELGVFIGFEITERFFQPDVVQLFQLTSHLNGFV